MAIAMGVSPMVMLRFFAELMELDSGQVAGLLNEARTAVDQHFVVG
jgi:hypothetical protein